MQRPEWAPDDVDMDSPSPARVYDALLGGSHNFEVDRRAASNGIAAVPDLPLVAATNRRFLRRTVGHLVDSGVRQFIDVGSGIPTVGNTHEIAQARNPDCRVAYVDIDAIAVAHAQSILTGNDRTIAIRGDLRAPETLLASPELTALIDLDEPVALLLFAVLHLVTDADNPAIAVAILREAMSPGSYLAVSHLTSTHRPTDADRLSSGVAQRDRVSLIFRPRDRIESFFGDFSLLPPGLVQLHEWRPDLTQDAEGLTGSALILGGVGRKG
jgi:hypothetical protein